jgi:hypothetical protein
MNCMDILRGYFPCCNDWHGEEEVVLPESQKYPTKEQNPYLTHKLNNLSKEILMKGSDPFGSGNEAENFPTEMIFDTLLPDDPKAIERRRAIQADTRNFPGEVIWKTISPNDYRQQCESLTLTDVIDFLFCRGIPKYVS